MESQENKNQENLVKGATMGYKILFGNLTHLSKSHFNRSKSKEFITTFEINVAKKEMERGGLKRAPVPWGSGWSLVQAGAFANLAIVY